MDIDQTWYFIRVFAAVTALVNFLETFMGKDNFKPGSIYDWDVLRTNFRITTTGILSKVLDLLFRYRMFMVIVFLQGLSATALIFNLNEKLVFIFLLILTISFALYNLRNSFGQDGSDQMLMIVLVSLCIAHSSSSVLIKEMSLYFIGAQSLLSYLSAGYSKIISSNWRTGTAMIGINRTDAYGAHYLFFWLRKHPVIAKMICWSVIIFECFLPFLVIFGQPYIFVFLAAAVVFHLMVAITMKLNTFFWAFLAALPAVLFISNKIAT